MSLVFLKTTVLLFMLLNPFLLVLYLTDLIKNLNTKTFNSVLLRAGFIATSVFVVCALIGESLFDKLLQVHFASFQLFGGVVFLIIGVRFVFEGDKVMESIRGEPQHIAGSIAMPVLIGPATVSVSVLAGQRMSPVFAATSIFTAVFLSIFVIMLLKQIHDYVRPRNEVIVERYIEIMGRITALVIGTFAIEMIMLGIKGWFPG